MLLSSALIVYQYHWHYYEQFEYLVLANLIESHGNNTLSVLFHDVHMSGL